MASRLRRLVFGPPRDIQDPNIFRHISLIAFLAWVGLGADGLSSSSYGPEEAFKALGDAHYLAPALALATAFTVFMPPSCWARALAWSRVVPSWWTTFSPSPLRSPAVPMLASAFFLLIGNPSSSPSNS